MTTAELIALLIREGVLLTASGEKLRVEGWRDQLTPELVAALVARKAEIMAVLRGDRARAAGELLVRALLEGRIGEEQFWDWEEWCTERGAIAEYQGGVSRSQADAVAYELLAAELEKLAPIEGPRVEARILA